jgi:hypothetical protein
LCSTLNHTDQILYCIWFLNTATNTCTIQQQLSLQVLRELSCSSHGAFPQAISRYLCWE